MSRRKPLAKDSKCCTPYHSAIFCFLFLFALSLSPQLFLGDSWSWQWVHPVSPANCRGYYVCCLQCIAVYRYVLREDTCGVYNSVVPPCNVECNDCWCGSVWCCVTAVITAHRKRDIKQCCFFTFLLFFFFFKRRKKTKERCVFCRFLYFFLRFGEFPPTPFCFTYIIFYTRKRKERCLAPKTVFRHNIYCVVLCYTYIWVCWGQALRP